MHNIYVGNDIVAYKHIRCIGKWKEERFLQKILVPTEIEQLHLQVNKDAYLWTLWTLKEAAYKLSCFLGNRNKFHANHFLVSADKQINNIIASSNYDFCNYKNASTRDYYLSTIQFNATTFYGCTLITHEMVHSLVGESTDFSKCIWDIAKHSNYNKNDYSNEVRLFTKEKLQEQGVAIDSINKDKDGIPFVQLKDKQKFISLSHDQQFVSFAFMP
jgi:phosphopantetheinyl transferase (holo-ACP synthase)